jgi:hypothetical protein
MMRRVDAAEIADPGRKLFALRLSSARIATHSA